MNRQLKRVIRILEKNIESLELVSYGLAPNPTGFCYERYGKVYHERELNELLDELSDEDEETLKELYLR